MYKVLILFLLFSANIFADTTLTHDLNFDGQNEKIRMSFYENMPGFKLFVNDNEVSAHFSDAYSADIQLIDINRNDNLKEIVVRGFGSSDQTDCFFYQFIDDKIVECGHLPSNVGFEAPGNGELIEHGWMGFYTIKLRYDFDTRKKTLTLVKDEFYEIDQSAEVKTSFTLLKNRDDNSAAAGTLKTGEKIRIVKTDIEPVCTKDENYMYDLNCDWFFIESASGIKGWIRGKDFFEKVEGLIWAG
jgi:hypothetical protein